MTLALDQLSDFLKSNDFKLKVVKLQIDLCQDGLSRKLTSCRSHDDNDTGASEKTNEEPSVSVLH